MRNETAYREFVANIQRKLSNNNDKFKGFLLLREPIHYYNEEKKEYKAFFDPLHYYYCYSVYVKIRKNDNVTVIVGKEGLGGKSTTAINTAAMVSPNLCMDNICYEPKDFFREFTKISKGKTPKGSSIVLDEGALFLFARDFTSKDSKEVIKFITIARQYNIALWICVPNWFDLDTHIRAWRADTIIEKLSYGDYILYKREAINKIESNRRLCKHGLRLVLKFCGLFKEYYYGNIYKWSPDSAMININDINEEDYKMLKRKNSDALLKKYELQNTGAARKDINVCSLVPNSEQPNQDET